MFVKGMSTHSPAQPNSRPGIVRDLEIERVTVFMPVTAELRKAGAKSLTAVLTAMWPAQYRPRFKDEK